MQSRCVAKKARSLTGVTTVAASASETPQRCASAVRERAGASPRVRSAASRAGRSTCLHWFALLWPMPNTYEDPRCQETNVP